MSNVDDIVNDVKIDKEKFNELLLDEDDAKKEKKEKTQSKKSFFNNEVASTEKINMFDKIFKKVDSNLLRLFCRDCSKNYDINKLAYDKYEKFITGKSTEMVEVKCPHCGGSRHAKVNVEKENIKEVLKEKFNVKQDISFIILVLMQIYDVITSILAYIISIPINTWVYFEADLKLASIRFFYIFMILYLSHFANMFFKIDNLLLSFILVIVTMIIVKWRN
jgi:hypothetical protein